MLRGLSPAGTALAVRSLSAEEAEAGEAHWPGWAHEGQTEPPGDWSTWVIKGGRGYGKTLAGAQWIASLVAAQVAQGGEPLRIALVGATIDDARAVMIEGRSGLLHVAERLVLRWSPSLRRLSFRGGAEAHLFSGATPHLLRGPEHHYAWCDELAKWRRRRRAGTCSSSTCARAPGRARW